MHSVSQHNYNEHDTDEPVVTDLRLAVLGICFLVCILFAMTLFIDVQVQKGNIPLPKWVSVGNVDDARILLSSILQAVSTVLGLVFSVVLLVLSMAATQFGPRLLRRFIIDQNGQGTIGLFAGTFLFSLFTLVAVHVKNGQEFVPQITAITAVILMILSFGALIFFSQSIRKEIQTGNLIARVDEDLANAITNYTALRQVLAKNNANISAEESTLVVHKRCLEEGYPLLADNAGYLQSIDYGKLITAATAVDAVIALKIRPGHFIITGTVLAHIIPAQKASLLTKSIKDALRVGPNRTLTQDLEFAIAQIVEVGIRALSPAVNDTFTGIACVDWLTNSISILVDLPDSGESWQDTMGRTRLIEVPVKFPRLVSAAFDMIREAGENNPAILIRLLQNFTRLGPHLKNNSQREAVMRQVTAVRELMDMQPFTQTDLKDLLEMYGNAREALKGVNLTNLQLPV